MLMVPAVGPLADDFIALGGKIFLKKSVSLCRSNVFEFFRSIIDFIKFYKKNSIDLLHFNGVGWRDSSVISARLCNIPIVLHLHNYYEPNKIRTNINFFLANKIIIVSASMCESFSRFPKILNKIECIYNGVDLNRFVEGQLGFRETLPVDSPGLIIGYVGQLSHRKGVDILIRASRAVVQAYPDVLFVIVGADGVHEEGYTDAMATLTVEMGVSDRFLFLGKRDDIPEVMNGCDLLLVPSRIEPFGKVIIEAMSCGKCVIASAVGGIPEIIKDGLNGRLVPAEDVEALQNTILELLRDEELRNKLAKNGRQTALEKFSIDALVSKTQALYARSLR